MHEFFKPTVATKGFLQIGAIIALVWIAVVLVKRLTGKNFLPIQDANGDIPLTNLTIHTGGSNNNSSNSASGNTTGNTSGNTTGSTNTTGK